MLSRTGGRSVLAAPPTPLTPLIGRVAEADELCALLRRADVRIVSLTGPGGAGKTRLSLEIAARLAADFGGAVAFVPLATVTDPAAVIPALANALGIRDERAGSLTIQIHDEVGDRPILLIIDNFEQVAPAAADLAALLAACPLMKALVTSRAVLHVRGEREHQVHPLPIPNPAKLPPLAELAANPAIALFLERAQSVRSDLVLTADNAQVLAELCARLDGLPLAIELAAARSKLLAPHAMLSRLANRLQLLSGGARDLPERQQTLRNAMSWSYDLLTPGEQSLFRRLGVFAGGFTLECAEIVAPDVHAAAADVLDGVANLVDNSLIRRSDSSSGAEAGEGLDDEPRFAMLGTIRDFALEHLAAAGELDSLRRRHAQTFRAIAEEAREGLDGHGQKQWLAQLRAEHENLRAALAWAVECGDAATGQAITGAIPRYWEIRGLFTEGRAWVERSLAIPGSRDRNRANALLAVARLARKQGDYARAIAAYEESLGIWRELDDRSGVAASLNNLGVVAQDQGDYPRAEALFADALALFREFGERPRIAASLNNLGLVARRKGELPAAAALYEESLLIWRELGDELRTALALNNLGVVAYGQGVLPRASSCYEQALAIYRAQGDQSGIALSLHNLAETVRDGGDPARAGSLWQESLELRAAQGDRAGVAESLAGLAGVAARAGLTERAARMFAQADRLREEIGLSLPPQERGGQERAIAALRTKMQDLTFSTAWAEGAAMSVEEAVADVIAGAADTERAASRTATAEADKSAAAASGLTRRELEVLRLLVDGKSDKEIGDALFISHRTAMTHVQNLLGKLGVNSRTAAAAHALRSGLV